MEIEIHRGDHLKRRLCELGSSSSPEPSSNRRERPGKRQRPEQADSQLDFQTMSHHQNGAVEATETGEAEAKTLRRPKLSVKRLSSSSFTNYSDKVSAVWNNETNVEHFPTSSPRNVSHHRIPPVHPAVPMLLGTATSNSELVSPSSHLDALFADDVDQGTRIATNFERMAVLESGIVQIIAAFLPITDILRLRLTSWTILNAMQGCDLRLDYLPRSVSQHDLERWFYDPLSSSKLTRWSITGVRVRPSINEMFWNLVNQKGLKVLILNGVVRSLDATEVSQCKNLETFDAGISCREILNVNDLESLHKLRYLYLRNVSNLTDTKFISPRANLVEVSFYMCQSIASLDGLRFCNSLSVLDLGGCTNLIDIEPLRSCPKLEQLSLADCCKLQDISTVKYLRKLHHLDLTGCIRLQSFQVLPFLSSLKTLRLFRTSSLPLLDLVFSASGIIRGEAVHAIQLSAFIDARLLIPVLVERLGFPLVDMDLLGAALSILAAFAKFEGSGSSALLDSGVLPFLLRVAGGESVSKECLPASRKVCFDILAKMCQNKESVPSIARCGVANTVICTLESLLWKDAQRDPCDVETIEHCASTMLFLAAVESERDQLVEKHPNVIRNLVRILQVGTSEAMAESAGALWNLAASLRIGAKIADTPHAVSSLVNILKCGSLTAKLQAAGALRNLAIVDANKTKLLSFGILEPLCELCVSRAASFEQGSTLGQTNIQSTPVTQTLSFPVLADFQEDIEDDEEDEDEIYEVEEDDDASLEDVGARTVEVSEGIHSPAPTATPVQQESLLFPSGDNGWSEEKIQLLVKAAATLRILATNEEVQRVAGTETFLRALIVLMSKDENEALKRQISGIILALSFNKQNRVHFFPSRGVSALLDTLDSCDVESILISCTGALWNLASHEGMEWAPTETSRAVKLLIKLLDNNNSDIVCRTAGTLRSLSYHEHHKELVAFYGGIPKLVKHISDRKATTQCLATLRLVASGSLKTRMMIVEANAIPALANLLRCDDQEGIYLTLSTLAHLVPNASTEVAKWLPVAELVRFCSWTEGPSARLICDDAAYILDRISQSSENSSLALLSESDSIIQQRLCGVLPLKRIRGVPGDVRTLIINAPVVGRCVEVEFNSYATVGLDAFAYSGKVHYEIEIIQISDSPSFGWLTPTFRSKNVLSDYGIGYPACGKLPQDSWGVDGIQTRIWPSNRPFGAPWKAGDVLSMCLNLSTGQMVVGVNGNFAFPFGKVRDVAYGVSGFAPGLSASRGTVLRLNFGSAPFKYNIPEPGFVPFAFAQNLYRL